MSEVDAVRDDFVALWARLAGFWGISPSAARVHAWLLGEEEPVGAERLMEALDMSRGAVSMAARELADWGLVEARPVGGSRRVDFVAVVDLERVVRGIVRTRKRREWDPILDEVGAFLPRLAGDRSTEAAVLRDRLRRIEGVVRFVDDLAESFLKGGALSRLGLKAVVAAAERKSRRRPRGE